jgi:hypothetical protein
MKRIKKYISASFGNRYSKEHLIEPNKFKPFSTILRDDVGISCITGLTATPAL